MLLNSWRSSYTRSFHQIRFIALLSLIASHSISFVNQTTLIPLETLWSFRLLQLITIFGVSFVVLASVTFRMAMNNEMTGDRLTAWPKSNIPLYLTVLIGLDTYKNHLVYESYEYLFHWDFLKTLLLAYLIIVILTRVHVLLVLALSLVITLFADPIKAWLTNLLIGPGDITDELIGWGQFHTQLTLLILGLALMVTRSIWHLTAKRSFKLFLTAMVSSAALVSFWHIETLQPSLNQYILLHNWMLNGLTGATKSDRLYMGAAWLPTALSSFVICHYSIKYRAFYERHSRQINLLSICLAMWAFTLNFISIPPYENILRIWDVPEFMTTNFVVEFFKLASVSNLFLLLTYLNRRRHSTAFEPLIVSFSRASFLIYLLCTSVTAVVSPYGAERYGFWGGTVAVSLITFTASFLVAELTQFLSQKKLRLVLAPQRS